MWSPVSSRMAGSLCLTLLLLLLLLASVCAGSSQCPKGYCHSNATCTMLPTTSFKCLCDAGYQGDGDFCWDVDECVEDPTLCENGTCVNQDGGYKCDCDEGVTQSRDERSCLTPGSSTSVYPVDEVKQEADTDVIRLNYPKPSGRVAYYLLSWSLLEGQNRSQKQDLPDGDEQQHSYILGVHPGSGYTISVAAQFINLTKHLFTTNIRTHPLIQSNMTITEVLCTDYDECDPSLKVEFTQTPKSVTQFDKYRFRLEGKDTLVRTLSRPAEAPGNSVVFSGLVPGRFYTITMWTVSRNVISEPVQSRGHLRPRQLTQLYVTDISPYEVTLTWEKPMGDYKYFALEYYPYRPKTNISIENLTDPADWLRYSASLNNFESERRYTEELGIKAEMPTAMTHTYSFYSLTFIHLDLDEYLHNMFPEDSLLPHTQYTFKVQVVSGLEIIYGHSRSGTYVPSEAFYRTVTTLEALPSVPSEFSVLMAQPRMLNFSWQVNPAEVNGVLRRFLLEYAPMNDPEAKSTLEFPGDARDGEVAGLVPGYYMFSLCAETGAGAGPAAQLLRHVDLEAPLELHRSTTTVAVSFCTDYSPPAAGGIAVYTLVLAEQPRNDTPAQLPSWLDVHALDVWPPYQVTKPYHLNSSIIEFTIGSEVCDAGGLVYCNGPLKPGTTYYVKLRVITANDNFYDSAYTIIHTDAESNYTAIIVSTVSVTMLILLFIIAIKIYCRIKYKQPGAHHLRTGVNPKPFYLNLLFRDQCAKEIAEAERPYDEIDDHVYHEID